MKLIGKVGEILFDESCLQNFELPKKMLIETPILISPKCDLPFKLMCDTNDIPVGEIIGKLKEKMFHYIYFASKTADAAQSNYTIKKKKILVLVFSFYKCKSFLVGTKVVLYIDHIVIKYLLNKKMQS